MGVREIPAKFVFICDMCGANQELGQGHSRTHRPTGWAWWRIERDPPAPKDDGQPAAAHPSTLLLCSGCDDNIGCLVETMKCTT